MGTRGRRSGRVRGFSESWPGRTVGMCSCPVPGEQRVPSPHGSTPSSNAEISVLTGRAGNGWDAALGGDEQGDAVPRPSPRHARGKADGRCLGPGARSVCRLREACRRGPKASPSCQGPLARPALVETAWLWSRTVTSSSHQERKAPWGRRCPCPPACSARAEARPSRLLLLPPALPLAGQLVQLLIQPPLELGPLGWVQGPVLGPTAGVQDPFPADSLPGVGARSLPTAVDLGT